MNEPKFVPGDLIRCTDSSVILWKTVEGHLHDVSVGIHMEHESHRDQQLQAEDKGI